MRKIFHPGQFRRPFEGHIFQPQEFMLIIWLLLLKALQRSFKTLFPCSNINDEENDSGKCVTTSHHVDENLDELVIGKVVTAVLHQAIDFLEKRDGQDQEPSQGGMIEFLPSIPLVIHLCVHEILA